ncbi:hypothetical protein BSLA_01f0438 [Burkholderia stabilis]|nr:hypothetical protein BSLA_01f0438 [Burkholderia stabilis]
MEEITSDLSLTESNASDLIPAGDGEDSVALSSNPYTVDEITAIIDGLPVLETDKSATDILDFEDI